MKLINYICTQCNENTEILYRSDETVSTETTCEKCGSNAKLFNIKNNTQVWKQKDWGFEK